MLSQLAQICLDKNKDPFLPLLPKLALGICPRCCFHAQKPQAAAQKFSPLPSLCLHTPSDNTGFVGENVTFFSRNTYICLVRTVVKSFFIAVDYCYQGKPARCWREAGGRAGQELVEVSWCVYFTGECMNVFRTAAGLWVCLVLAERRGEFLLELLSYCPSECLCSGPRLWGALGTEAASWCRMNLNLREVECSRPDWMEF